MASPRAAGAVSVGALSPRGAGAHLAPPPRTWLVDHGMAACSPSVPPLIILSWNLLMDAPHHDFQYLSAQHGAWAHRWPLLSRELQAHLPDAAGLQEVSHLDALSADFSSSHYVLFAPKLSPAASPGDGCALLLNRARFELKDVQVLYLAAAEQEGCEATLSNQNAIIATARDVLAQRWVVLAVTHLKASQTPAAERERLCQVEQLAAAVRGARVRAEEASGAGAGAVPALLMGDFNTFPGQRPYYALLTLAPELASAYNRLERAECTPADYGEGEPPHTTYKFRGGVEKRVTEDYIFYSAGRGLQRRALLRLPSVAELGEGRGMPSSVYPSDHLLLGCQFVWEEGEELGAEYA